MNYSCVATALLLLATQSCPVAAGAPGLPGASEQVCRGGKVLGEVAKGDLNADGVADIAFFIECDPTTYTSELVVLLGGESGGHKILARTTFVPHDRRWDEVKIRRGLLVLAQGCAAACNSNWNRSFKFRYQAGHMRLIGQDSSRYEQDFLAQTTDMVEYVNNYGSSINYLTGTAIHWREAKKRKIKVSRKVHFAAGANIPLEGFDADSVIPGVHGYVDEDFVLRLVQKD